MTNYSKLSALVVTDSPLLQRIHSTILVRLGFRTIDVAENGQKAVDFHTAGGSYDLILINREMSIKDGDQTTRELRGMGVKSMIVGVTVDEDAAARASFIAAGLNRCLQIPLSIADVAALADQIMNEQQN